ncbi:MAG: response regulator [Desulfofustis sp.]|nr:response regulator [Desulfofustis sp.]
MGLALVHSIVTRNEGLVEVQSEVARGAVFRVLLPVVVRQRSSGLLVQGDDVFDGKGRIILVDDEGQVVQVIGELLRSIGYHVSGWTSAKAALEHFRENPEAYDLLVTDLTMPHMTGVELSAEIKRIRSNLPVVLITGYSDRLTREFAMRSGVDEYCMKPVSLRDLSGVVGQLLGLSEQDRFS